MSDYLLQMIEVQASVITDLTEVNKRLLLELEQYRAIEEEDNIILTMMKDIEEGKEDLTYTRRTGTLLKTWVKVAAR